MRGASKGEGLGNAFLANIRAVDGIFHVVRTVVSVPTGVGLSLAGIFEEAEVTHVEGSVDPIRDLEVRAFSSVYSVNTKLLLGVVLSLCSIRSSTRSSC